MRQTTKYEMIHDKRDKDNLEELNLGFSTHGLPVCSVGHVNDDEK
jgi:hypothetical protein